MAPLTLAAENAFWDHPRTTVLSYATYSGIEVDPKAPFFEVLFVTMTGILEIADEEVRNTNYGSGNRNVVPRLDFRLSSMLELRSLNS